MDWDRDALIRYLTLYRNAARRHSAAAVELARLQSNLDATVRTGVLHPRKRGRPLKAPKAVTQAQLAELERAVGAAQARVRAAWQAYRRLDDMHVLPPRAAHQAAQLLDLLRTGQAQTLAEALAFLERQGK